MVLYSRVLYEPHVAQRSNITTADEALRCLSEKVLEHLCRHPGKTATAIASAFSAVAVDDLNTALLLLKDAGAVRGWNGPAEVMADQYPCGLLSAPCAASPKGLWPSAWPLRSSFTYPDFPI